MIKLKKNVEKPRSGVDTSGQIIDRGKKKKKKEKKRKKKKN